jgi:hypothetical protein
VVWIVRWLLPAAIFVAGAIVLIARNADSTALEVFAMATGAALSVLLLGWLVRLGNAGESVRADEERAREYYTQHGHWPGEG